jgi:tetratricopeptide (TPR) repeat protein
MGGKKMKKSCLTLLIFSFLLFSAQNPDSFEEAKSILQKGVETWNSEDLERARSLFLNLCLREKKENPYFYYYLSLADYRLSNYYLVRKEKEKAGKFIEEGLSFLEKAIKLEPAFYESYALYASLLGLKINLKPEEAMFLGMESERYFSIALEKGGDNPRVNLLKGISTLYTPEMFGGGAKNALKFIEKSVSLFEKEKIDNPLTPSWGKEEAYTYLGIIYEKLGEREKAVQAFKKALETNSNFGYAKINLERIEKEGK